MKKSLLCLALVAGFAGAASAQSGVTLFGTIDLSGKYVKNDGSDKRLSLSRDGLNSSQLGFRGIEDLGDGMKAGFTLISSVGADSGDIGTGQAPNKFWHRRATVSLYSKFGELRLGRDYTPTFWNNGIFDPFGIVGIGATANTIQMLTTTSARADNAIGYFLPSNLGGFYGQAMMAAGELGQPAGNNGRYLGARGGWATEAFDVAVSVGEQRNAIGYPVLGNTQRTYNLGSSYNFGFMKLMAIVDRDVATNRNETRGTVGAIIPFGQAELRFGYDRSKLHNSGNAAGDFHNEVWQAKAGGVYNVSKRTALYTTVSYLENDDHSGLGVAVGSSVSAAPTPGGTSKGFEIGVRHFF